MRVIEELSHAPEALHSVANKFKNIGLTARPHNDTRSDRKCNDQHPSPPNSSGGYRSMIPYILLGSGLHCMRSQPASLGRAAELEEAWSRCGRGGLRERALAPREGSAFTFHIALQGGNNKNWKAKRKCYGASPEEQVLTKSTAKAETSLLGAVLLPLPSWDTKEWERFCYRSLAS